MLVFVKTMAGQTLRLDIKASDFVADVKRTLEPQLHLMPQMQQLYFGSKLLDDRDTISKLMSAGLETGSTLRVIGVRPGTAPMSASRARLLEMYIDSSSQAKEASVKEAKDRRRSFEADKAEKQARAAHLLLARDLGAKYRLAAAELQVLMRSELLRAGYLEDPTQADQTATVIKQRDYLIGRGASWMVKSGGGHGVLAFEKELLEECDLAKHESRSAPSTTTHYDVGLVDRAHATTAYAAAAERLALSAEEAGALRREVSAAVHVAHMDCRPA